MYSYIGGYEGARYDIIGDEEFPVLTDQLLFLGILRYDTLRYFTIFVTG